MIVDLGFFVYIFALSAPAIYAVIGFVKRQKFCKTAAVGFVLYIFAVNVLKCVFPLRLGECLPEFPTGNDFWIYGILVPFWHWGDMDILILRDAFQTNIGSCIFGAISAFILTVSVKKLRGLKNSFILCLVSSTAFMLATVLPNIILGGLNKPFRCNSGIFFVLFYAVGFLLAKLVVRLTPELTVPFDGERIKIKRSDEMQVDTKLRRKTP